MGSCLAAGFRLCRLFLFWPFLVRVPDRPPFPDDKLKKFSRKKNFSISPEERDQIWAEAKTLWQNGEKLYLEGDLIREAEAVQATAMEEDDRQGMVEAYLDMPLPANWPDMDLYARRNYLYDAKDPLRAQGVLRRETVSNVEIWAECFGRDPAVMKKGDSYEIAAIMMSIRGWDKSGKRERLPLYGMQRLYVRKAETCVPLLPIPGVLKGEACAPVQSELLMPETDEPLPIMAALVESSGLVAETCDDVTSVTANPESFWDFLL